MASPSRPGLSSSLRLSSQLSTRLKTLIRPQPYQWDPLEGQQIRLVTLLPGQHKEAPRVEISVCKSDSSPPYTAVSYAWGNGDQTEDLRVANQDDSVIKITKNLKSALCHMRSATDEVVLWIDQICINQRDTAEKNAQVGSMMAKIYKRASQLLLWLGDESEDSKIALKTIREACSELEAQGKLAKRQMLEESEGLAGILDPVMAYVTLYDEKGDFKYRAWLAVVKLLARPWFRRLWVPMDHQIPTADY